MKGSRKIIQKDLEGNFIQEFNSLIEIKNILKIKITNISSVCKGTRLSSQGFKWEFGSNPDVRCSVGDRFGKLTILEKSQIVKGKSTWLCQCDCGNTKIIKEANLVNNHTKSCGCIHKSILIKNSTTHGLSNIPEYYIWQTMKARCLNSKNKAYKNYGNRGIKVCKEWLDSFEVFLKDMGVRPTPKHTIERKKNDEGYSKENCFWATREIQSNNKRNNLLINYNGKTQTLMQWSHELNINYSLLRSRIKELKWSIEKAFTLPLQNKIK